MPTRLIPNPVFPPEATPFAQIAATIRPRLASYCGIDPGFVYPVANDNYEVTSLEPFFLYFQIFGIEAFGDTGGGRRNPWATRRLRVYLYTRQGVDIYGSDEAALIGATSGGVPIPAPPSPTPSLPVGQFQAEELVIGALFNWMPLSNIRRPLLTEPIHPAEGSGPAIRKPENTEGLLRTNLDFSMRYNLAIDLTDPAR